MLATPSFYTSLGNQFDNEVIVTIILIDKCSEVPQMHSTSLASLHETI